MMNLEWSKRIATFAKLAVSVALAAGAPGALVGRAGAGISAMVRPPRGRRRSPNTLWDYLAADAAA